MKTFLTIFLMSVSFLSYAGENDVNAKQHYQTAVASNNTLVGIENSNNRIKKELNILIHCNDITLHSFDSSRVVFYEEWTEVVKKCVQDFKVKYKNHKFLSE